MSHAEGPLDFDLPDLVQRIEFADDTPQGPALTEEEATPELLSAAGDSPVDISADGPAVDEPRAPMPPPEADEHSLWRPRR